MPKAEILKIPEGWRLAKPRPNTKENRGKTPIWISPVFKDRVKAAEAQQALRTRDSLADAIRR